METTPPDLGAAEVVTPERRRDVRVAASTYSEYYRRMDKSKDVKVSELRSDMAEVLSRVAIHRETVFLTSHGRRIAAVVPLDHVETDAVSGSGHDVP